jgi:enterochelin esterase-like enzyme
MRRSLGLLLVLALFLLLSTSPRADSPPLAPAPKGFDTRRDDIERGKVETVEYESKAIGGKRRMMIYTPPGYSADAKYPVLYLLHGAGDNETGWTRSGAAAAILDNLYADKKAVPMIVVMPNGSTPPTFNMGPLLAGAILKRADTDKDGKLTVDELVAAARQLFEECDKEKKGVVDQKQLAEGINRLLANTESAPPGGRRGPQVSSAFEDDLLKTIIPYVEAHYAVRPGPGNRAVAGLSMGGGRALTIGLRHLDTFAWVGGFSSALFGRTADLVRDPAATAGKLRLLWVSCGDTDRLMDASKAFHTTLDEKKVPHVWHVDSGGHTWPVWKNDLYLLAQQLFREK